MIEKIANSKLFIFFVAFTLSNGILINYFNSNGLEGLGTITSSYSLNILTVLSFIIAISTRGNLKRIVILFLLLYMLVFYERSVDAYGTVRQFESGFLIHGTGGFLMGLAIKDVNRFTRYISILSSIYLLIFIFEPLTHSFLHLDEMITGYLMTGLTINLILAYFTVYYRNKYLFVLAVISTLTVSLFTARGCGLALVLSWSAFYFWDKKRKGVPVAQMITKYTVLAICAYLLVTYIISQVISSGVSYETGSLIEKIVNGYAGQSNGRDEVWETGISMVMQAPLKGLGFGADRTVAEVFFVHNIFLELCLDFGIPLMLLIVILYWRFTLKGISSNIYSLFTALIIAQIAKTWIQLLFSSSYLNTMLPLMFIVGLGLNAYSHHNETK